MGFAVSRIRYLESAGSMGGVWRLPFESVEGLEGDGTQWIGEYAFINVWW